MSARTMQGEQVRPGQELCMMGGLRLCSFESIGMDIFQTTVKLMNGAISAMLDSVEIVEIVLCVHKNVDMISD